MNARRIKGLGSRVYAQRTIFGRRKVLVERGSTLSEQSNQLLGTEDASTNSTILDVN